MKVITQHAAAVLSSMGEVSSIACLDITNNSRLVALSVKELWSIHRFQSLECDRCTSLTTLPLLGFGTSVANPSSKFNSAFMSMKALHESLFGELLRGRCVVTVEDPVVMVPAGRTQLL